MTIGCYNKLIKKAGEAQPINQVSYLTFDILIIKMLRLTTINYTREWKKKAFNLTKM